MQNISWNNSFIYMLTKFDTKTRSSGNQYPDSKGHRANMGPTWVLSAPDGPHVGPMILAIRVLINIHWPVFNIECWKHNQITTACPYFSCLVQPLAMMYMANVNHMTGLLTYNIHSNVPTITVICHWQHDTIDVYIPWGFFIEHQTYTKVFYFCNMTVMDVDKEI